MLKQLITDFFQQLVTITSKKIDAMNQQAAKEQQIRAQQAKKNTENALGSALRKRWASALNSLPAHLSISGREIDSFSLSNALETSYWELSVPVPEMLNKSKCKQIQSALVNILSNQCAEAYQDFQQKIFDDANEYATEILRIQNGGGRVKDDIIFYQNYNKYFWSNNYRLINITIINTEFVDGKLYIQYNFEDNDCSFFHVNNYWNLIRRAL